MADDDGAITQEISTRTHIFDTTLGPTEDNMPSRRGEGELRNCWCVNFGAVLEEEEWYCPICKRRRTLPLAVAKYLYIEYCEELLARESGIQEHPTVPVTRGMALREAISHMRLYAYNESFAPWRIIVRPETRDLYQITWAVLLPIASPSEALMRSHLLVSDVERHFSNEFDARLDPLQWHVF